MVFKIIEIRFCLVEATLSQLSKVINVFDSKSKRGCLHPRFYNILDRYLKKELLFVTSPPTLAGFQELWVRGKILEHIKLLKENTPSSF